MAIPTKFNWKNLSQWLIVGGIFTERYYEFMILMIVGIVNTYIWKKFEINIKLLVFFVALFFYSLILLSSTHYTPYKFFQQYFLLFLFFVFYYSFFYLNRNEILNIFRKYLFIAYFVALLGVIQWFIYFLTEINIFSFIYGRITIIMGPRILRINSIIDEASYLSTLLTPAATYYIILKGTLSQKEKFRKYIIYACIFLTFSSVTYLIMVLVIIYKYLFVRKYLIAKVITLIILTTVGSGFFFLLSTPKIEQEKNIFSDIVMKITDTTLAFKDLDPESFDMLNMSSYATITNIWVAMNAPNRCLGTGLGTHEQNYYKTYYSDSIFYGINAAEGYSLFNRIFSEFGFVGIILLLLLIGKLYNKESIINISVFFIILTLLIRGGHYTRYGTIFFFYLYYYTSSRIIKKRISDQ